MKILFTGSGGKAGSWHMRGVQMAATHADWRAVPKATADDLTGMDAVVLVKRVPKETHAAIKKWGGPFIYDALDFWSQPNDALGISSTKEARVRFREHFAKVDADVVLATNTFMRVDLEPLCRRVEVLPHHFDPGLAPRKESNGNIVYWGHPRYLDQWRDVMQGVCSHNGVRFLVNPTDPTECDAMFAMRGGLYGSWLDRRWKSSVKGATAMALGVPLIAWPESSYVEYCGSHTWSFTSVSQLDFAVRDAMKRRHEVKPDTAFSVQNMAKRLEKILGA